MNEALRYVHRLILRWQLRSLDGRIQDILIARNDALATMIALRQERSVKERMLAGIESMGS